MPFNNDAYVSIPGGDETPGVEVLVPFFRFRAGRDLSGLTGRGRDGRYGRRL